MIENEINTDTYADESNSHIVDNDSKYLKVDDDDIEEANVLDDDEINTEDFSEVLNLTEYNDSLVAKNDYVVADYEDISLVEIEERHKTNAKNFVGKITKFILDFKDVELTDAHKKYLKQVGNFQLDHLNDLLLLVSVNKQMLSNIIARVNATQAEDYAIINSYNNLINQHLKLIKELQNTYRSIPTVLKKMKADILCNQELEENNEENEVITQEFGKTQFNNGKQIMREILDKYKHKKE